MSYSPFFLKNMSYSPSIWSYLCLKDIIACLKFFQKKTCFKLPCLHLYYAKYLSYEYMSVFLFWRRYLNENTL